MDEFVGTWTGDKEFKDIVQTLEAYPPREHRLPSPTAQQWDEDEQPEATPPGTQNPEPPGSGAPFLPSYRMAVPPMVSGHDAVTPTPGGGVVMAVM